MPVYPCPPLPNKIILYESLSLITSICPPPETKVCTGFDPFATPALYNNIRTASLYQVGTPQKVNPTCVHSTVYTSQVPTTYR